MATAIEEAIYRLRVEEKGIDEAAASVERLSIAEEKLARSTRSTEAGFERLRSSLDPAVKARQQYEQTLLRLAGHEQAGIGTERERAEALNLATQRYNAHVTALARVSGAHTQLEKSAGLARHELVNLSRQAQDIGVSLASGQSPFTVLVQQGTQVADIFASSQGTLRGFFSQVTAGASAVLTPVRAVTAGVVGLAAAGGLLADRYAASQGAIQRALMGTARDAGVTLADINRVAKESSSLLGLSSSEARDAAIAFAQTGKIYGDNLKAAADVTHGFALVTGKEVPDAFKTLAGALAEPVAGYDALVKQLGGYDGRVRSHIVQLVAAGKEQQAQRVILDEVAKATEKAVATLSPLEKIWNAIGNAASGAASGLKAGANAILEAPSQLVTQDRGSLEEGLRLAQGRQAAAAPDSARWRMATAGVEMYTKALRDLDAAQQQAAQSADDKRFGRIAQEADAAVRSLIPQIEQLERLAVTRAKIRDAQRSPGARDRMQDGGGLDEAGRAADLMTRRIAEGREQAARAAEEVLRIADSFNSARRAAASTVDQQQAGVTAAAEMVAGVAAGGAGMAALAGAAEQFAQAGNDASQAQRQISVEVSNIAARNQDALMIAQARTGVERMAAQDIALASQLRIQGLTAEQISLLVAQQRAIAQAQINANAQATLISLQDQIAVAGAYNEQEKISAQYVATRNQLIRDGVNPALAEQVAQMEAAVAQQAEMVRQTKEYEQAQIAANQAVVRSAQQTAASIAQANFNEANNWVARWYAAFRAKRYLGGFEFSDFTMGKNLWEKDGGYTQFNPAGYKSQILDQNVSPLIGVGKSNITNSILGPSINTEGLTGLVDQLLSQGGSIMDAISRVIDSGAVIDQSAAQFLQQITDLLPDDQKAAAIEREIAALKEQPISLGRETLLKQLTDSLDQLKTSTDGLNSTLQNVLSPIYTQDPRLTNLGFRADTQPLTYNPFAQPPSGLAGGGTITIPGTYTGQDNYLLPVASGERITAETPAQQQEGGGRVYNISMPVTIYAPDKATGRETAFQAGQRLRRVLREN